MPTGVKVREVADTTGNTYKNISVDKTSIKDLAQKITAKGEGSKGTGKGKIEDFTKEILETKPMNSPIPEKWYKKGGSISIEDNGTWTYTNKSGTSVSYPNGYPDFTPYMHPNVKPVKIKVYSPKNNPKDFENANKAARLTKDTDPPIIDIRRPPDGYTWHHHEDGKTMQLVDEDIHREIRHIGGQSKVNGKNK
ncbi:HNH endonuclease [Peribacillus sp. NPDC097675]|uniref:HNH endonuclease n=1 Tax=Peribacillus sp. NPDC097675 TaxID=3390618 RepID=UPI003D06FE0E